MEQHLKNKIKQMFHVEQKHKEQLKTEENTFISCKDHTVSKERFSLLKLRNYEILKTQPVPKNLNNYYESDNYISHTDSKKTILDKIYQIVKSYTLKKKLKLINSLNSCEKTILDIGAGTGDFLKVCNDNNWIIKGIEPSENARLLASKKHLNLESDINNLSNEKFDIITMWHVLEHIPNLDEYIEKLKYHLKENGTLIIAVPNYKSYDAKYYKEYWAAYDVPRHIWHFSQSGIIKKFSEKEMTLQKIIPMKFDSFYVSLLSEKYKKGKTNFFSAFYIGLISNIKAKKKKEYSSLIYTFKKNKN